MLVFCCEMLYDGVQCRCGVFGFGPSVIKRKNKKRGNSAVQRSPTYRETTSLINIYATFWANSNQQKTSNDSRKQLFLAKFSMPRYKENTYVRKRSTT